MITKKYMNVITGEEIVVYPWTSKDIKIKVEGKDYIQMFEEY